MIQTIFIDFGNVIGFFSHRKATEALAKFSDMPIDQLHHLLHVGELLDQYEHGHLSTAEYVRLAREQGRITCEEAEFLHAFTDIFWPNPEVCELIPRLTKQRLVLASNTCDAHFVKFSETFADTLRHLHELGASHTLRARKPHRAFYENAQKLAIGEPGECLFIDDREDNIAAAAQFGWQTIHYRPDGTLEQKLRAAGVEIR